ncbi:MAG: hypothetical protein AMXMBFR20_17940 [Planctomycetia bacterium]
MGQLAGQQLETENAEGIDITAGIDVGGVALQLLGAHVSQCSDEFADGGLHGGLEIGVDDAGDAEVENDRSAMGAGGGGGFVDPGLVGDEDV